MKIFISVLIACYLANNVSGEMFTVEYDQEMYWCNQQTQEKFFADFNGDNRDDIFCNGMGSEGLKSISFSKQPYGYGAEPDWELELAFCSGEPGTKLYIGDFNGDNRDDLLCHDFITGQKLQLFAQMDGTFKDEIVQYTTDFCKGSAKKILVGDFNGDSKEDLMCQSTVYGNATKWIVKADDNGQFREDPFWTQVSDWCSYDSMTLYIGKYNADDRADMLCHDLSNGYRWVELAQEDGSFNEQHWESTTGWCHTKARSLLVGDFNADGRDDMICQYLQNGHIWISFSNDDGSFGDTDWQGKDGWCVGIAEFGVGDVNGDHKADLICSTFSTLYLAMTESSL